MHPLETYLAEIAGLRGATKETSGYPALFNLLNAVGHTLKPIAELNYSGEANFKITAG